MLVQDSLVITDQDSLVITDQGSLVITANVPQGNKTAEVPVNKIAHNKIVALRVVN
jgi:hypothetical protein